MNIILLIISFLITHSIYSMIEHTDRVPTLKRLISENYWKDNDSLPQKGKINDAVEKLLIAYAPLNRTTVVRQFTNARFIDDEVRVAECKTFIKEKNLKESELKLFLQGMQAGATNRRKVITYQEKDFYKTKEERLKETAAQANVKPEELVVDVKTEYKSEEEMFQRGIRAGNFCVPLTLVYLGVTTFILFLIDYFQKSSQ